MEFRRTRRRTLGALHALPTSLRKQRYGFPVHSLRSSGGPCRSSDMQVLAARSVKLGN